MRPAQQLIAQLVEEPPRRTPAESAVVQAVAARVRATTATGRIRSAWMRGPGCRPGPAPGLLYGTPLTGPGDGRTAVVIQPSAGNEVAPLVALAYTTPGKSSMLAPWHAAVPNACPLAMTAQPRWAPRSEDRWWLLREGSLPGMEDSTLATPQSRRPVCWCQTEESGHGCSGRGRSNG